MYFMFSSPHLSISIKMGNIMGYIIVINYGILFHTILVSLKEIIMTYLTHLCSVCLFARGVKVLEEERRKLHSKYNILEY